MHIHPLVTRVPGTRVPNRPGTSPIYVMQSSGVRRRPQALREEVQTTQDLTPKAGSVRVTGSSTFGPQQNPEIARVLTHCKKELVVVLGLFCTALLAQNSAVLEPHVRRLWQIQGVYPLEDKLGAVPTFQDALFVAGCFLAVVFSRALVLTFCVTQVAGFVGISNPRTVIRFAEQAWLFLYYLGTCVTGTYLLYLSEYSMDPSSLWNGFPHLYIDPTIKAFYLFELGFWLTQIYFIHVEKRRKDHYQMLLHHTVTCLLVLGSYTKSYTRIGHIVMIIMDVVDTVLSLAKLCKYMDLQPACDLCFGVFVLLWIVCRHVIFLYQLWYAWVEAPKYISESCGIDPSGSLHCFSTTVHNVFGMLMLLLQLVTIVWLVMILNVVYRVLKGEGADDTRSDDESD